MSFIEYSSGYYVQYSSVITLRYSRLADKDNEYENLNMYCANLLQGSPRQDKK